MTEGERQRERERESEERGNYWNQGSNLRRVVIVKRVNDQSKKRRKWEKKDRKGNYEGIKQKKGKSCKVSNVD